MQTQYHSNSGLQLLTAAALVLGTAFPAAVVAQDLGQLILEEIIVTAQKRVETLQDVPISVSVLGSDVLNRCRTGQD